MATFVLKIGKEQETIEGNRISIGTRSTCSFTLDDPLAADVHCDIILRGSEFVVMDRGSSLGTFVNGRQVVEATALADGDTIVCAVSIMGIALQGDTLTLTLSRGRFYYDDKKDGLDLSQREIRFGEFRPVSIFNWIASFAMILLFPLCFFGRTSDVLLEPSETYHSKLAAYHEQLKDLDEADRDCNACHSAFDNQFEAKCLECHKEDIGRPGQHPAYTNAGEWEQGCVHCHVDHRGDSEGVLIARPAPETCNGCHARDRKIDHERNVAIQAVAITVSYDSFAHADHKGMKVNNREIGCGDCHEGYAADVAHADRIVEGGRTREFSPVDYAKCMKCHDGSVRDIANLKPAWHGTEQNGKYCLSCHAAVHDGARRKIEGSPVMRRYELATRSHLEQASANVVHADGKACADCHRQGEELVGGRSFKDRAFVHGTHIFNLQPPTLSEKARLSGSLVNPKAGFCTHCHADIAQADSLSLPGPHNYQGDKSCKDCHSGEPHLKEIQVLEAKTKRNEFPHGLHTKVEGGCFACHEFDAADVTALPTTPPDVQSCMRCHQGHESVGGGHCDSCHKKGDPSFSGKGLSFQRPSDADYRHWSAGHRAMTEKGQCVDCHGTEVWDAKKISELRIPMEDAPQCRRCHVEKKGRFHWR